jgi:copper(I)-binding protein
MLHVLRVRPLVLAAISFLTVFGAALAAASAPPIEVEGAWVRAAAGGQANTGAFMTFRNPSEADVAIVSVTSPSAKVAELHEMRDENGVMRMRKTDRLTVPARGTLILKPGGLHVMLFQLSGPLAPGSTVKLTFTTADGSTFDVAAEVRALR